MSATVDKYFKLVDTAGRGKDQLNELANLFADDGILTPAGMKPINGKKAILEYLTTFYTTVADESRHFYNTTSDSRNRVEADWAVSGRLKQGSLVSLQGHNLFELTDDGKIKSLSVYND